MAKSPDPAGNMGVYKRLSDVPDRYRLQNFSAAYEGRDVWGEYVSDRYPNPSENQQTLLRRFKRRWTSLMDDQGRHHALATPEDVEAFSSDLVENNTLSTAYSNYWQRLEVFYTWLQSHTDHPHVYHPVLMAAAEYPNASAIWDYRIARTGVKSQ